MNINTVKLIPDENIPIGYSIPDTPLPLTLRKVDTCFNCKFAKGIPKDIHMCSKHKTRAYLNGICDDWKQQE